MGDKDKHYRQSPTKILETEASQEFDDDQR